MKFGQALSVFEAALPEEIAGPYRAALTKLQEAAPPLPAATRAQGARRAARPALAAALPRVRRRRRPPRPASARCTGPSGSDGRDGRRSRSSTRAPARRCIADLSQLSRLAGLFRVIQPGLDVKPLVAELRGPGHRGARLRAGGRRRSGPSPRRTPTTREIFVPRVVAAAPRVLVTEWIDGHAAVARSSPTGARTQRDLAGQLLATLHFSAPQPGRAAARRPAPGQLPAARRRPARRASTSARWPGCPAGTPSRSAG